MKRIVISENIGLEKVEFHSNCDAYPSYSTEQELLFIEKLDDLFH